MTQFALWIVTAAALFLVQLQPAFAQFYFDGYDLPEKKSHQGIQDFTNALNGAARLRYGKRSSAPLLAPSESESAVPSDVSESSLSTIIGYNPKFHAADWIPRYQDKRSPASSLDSMPQFLQSLNGAERLRFG
jgi:hypothetical protein